jgi:FAD/FMN-containing dehydrogenase
MCNAYYRYATELVKGVVAPLPAGSPFYILMESSGSDGERLRTDVEKLLEEALGEGIISDATIASSGAAAAAIWRVRDSSVEVGHATAPSVGSDISLAIEQMEPFTKAIEKAIKKVDKDAVMTVLGHVGDGNLHVNAKYSPPADKHEEMKEIIYSITADFGGSISAEHGIGIARRPYLKLSRTPEEIETMRTLKRALDPHHILNPGRIFTI